MSTFTSIRRTATAAALVASLGLSAAGVANAAPTPLGTPVATSTSVQTTASLTPDLQRILAGASSDTSGAAFRAIEASRTSASLGSIATHGRIGVTTTTPQAIWIRIAVKAAMEVVKRVAPALWRQITGFVVKGKTVFVNWWNKSVPGWVKGMLGGISASAIYDALRWLIGI